MPDLLRSRRFAFLALAAFLLAQPVVGCAALCLLERHHAEQGMAGMGGGPAASGGTTCHTGVTDADHHAPAQTLSPMEPARPAVIAAAPADSVEPVALHSSKLPLVSYPVEPPPPRFV